MKRLAPTFGGIILLIVGIVEESTIWEPPVPVWTAHAVGFALIASGVGLLWHSVRQA